MAWNLSLQRMARMQSDLPEDGYGMELESPEDGQSVEFGCLEYDYSTEFDSPQRMAIECIAEFDRV